MEELWLWPGGLQASVLYRAMNYLPNSTAIAFQLAEIEEERGDFNKAQAVLTRMADLEPLSTASLKRLQLEQRRGSNIEAVSQLFEEVYTKMPGIAEGSEIALKYSDFLRAQGEHVEAKDILDRALEVDTKNSKLYSAMLMLLKFLNPSEAIKICDEAIASEVTIEMKVKFAEEKIIETEAMGLSLAIIKKAKIEYQDLVTIINSQKIPTKQGLKCDSCDTNMSDQNSLRKHKILMHTGPANCERCNIDFDDKYTLKIHIKTCLWKCSVCPYNSLNKYNIVKHEKSKHS